MAWLKVITVKEFIQVSMEQNVLMARMILWTMTQK
jgi:hypothetical protein